MTAQPLRRGPRRGPAAGDAGADRAGLCRWPGAMAAAALAEPITDTLKRADENRFVTGGVPRENLYAMQTPQIFARDLLDAPMPPLLRAIFQSRTRFRPWSISARKLFSFLTTSGTSRSLIRAICSWPRSVLARRRLDHRSALPEFRRRVRRGSLRPPRETSGFFSIWWRDEISPARRSWPFFQIQASAL